MEVLLPLCVLPLCVLFFTWIEQRVLPQMWETGRLFDRAPTAGERVLQKTAKGAVIVTATLWWTLVLSIIVSVVLG